MQQCKKCGDRMAFGRHVFCCLSCKATKGEYHTESCTKRQMQAARAESDGQVSSCPTSSNSVYTDLKVDSLKSLVILSLQDLTPEEGTRWLRQMLTCFDEQTHPSLGGCAEMSTYLKEKLMDLEGRASASR